MQDFGVAEKQVMRFKLGGKKTYELPLLSSMPISTIREFAKASAIEDEDARNVALLDVELKMLRDNIGDVADKLTTGQVTAIFEAWHAENENVSDEGEF